MIYLVTTQTSLLNSTCYEAVTVERSIEVLRGWKMLMVDSETTGTDPHICELLTFQIGTIDKEVQVVIDCTTIDIRLYKDILENAMCIGHNLKFDLQFLYNYSIIPRKVYDTMIVEQLLFLGYPSGIISYSLAAVAHRRLDIYIDKTVRGEIIWRGLDEAVIKYAADDVVFLYDIMKEQMVDCKSKDCIKGAELECDAVPAMAYLEWCGIKLDIDKWKEKMRNDQANLDKAKKDLDDFIVKKYEENKAFSPFVKVKQQYSIFDDNSDIGKPKASINWSSSKQVIEVAKLLGFDTVVQDKKTGEDKDSVIEKHLSNQKGINDEFIKLYFEYQGCTKVVTSYGQGHIDAVNPKTGRIHTVYRQLATSSGRLSCGSSQSNTALEKYKKLPKGSCKYPNCQQLPADDATRGAFVPPEGHTMVSADFSAEESRLGADIYNDTEMLNEFLHGSGDMHSLFAWMVFRDECTALGCKCVEDVKKKAPKWRKKVKAVEFAWMFGAAAPTISQAAGCTVAEAEQYILNLEKGFTGVAQFAAKGSQFVRKNGYILINPITGHKKYWWDHSEWLNRQKKFTPEFWEDYRNNHKGTGDSVALEVRQHFQAAAKYDRDARNVVTQGTGAIIMKDLMTELFNWIVDNGHFNKVHLCASVHDEVVLDYPNELDFFPSKLEEIMERSAAKYCKSLPIPAEASVGDHWIH